MTPFTDRFGLDFRKNSFYPSTHIAFMPSGKEILLVNKSRSGETPQSILADLSSKYQWSGLEAAEGPHAGMVAIFVKGAY